MACIEMSTMAAIEIRGGPRGNNCYKNESDQTKEIGSLGI